MMVRPPNTDMAHQWLAKSMNVVDGNALDVATAQVYATLAVADALADLVYATSAVGGP